MEQDLYLHGLIGGAAAPTSAWTRPADWITVPDLLPEDDKIYLLNHVYPNTSTNYLAFACTGNYTVDWGDGTTENVASGVTAEHQYDFNTITSALTDLGYKQCIVTITPNGGALLTANFNKIHSAVNTTYDYSSFVEFKMNCPSMTDLGLNNFWLSDITFISVERIVIGQHNFNNVTGVINDPNPKSLQGYFAYLYGLKEIVINGLFDEILDANEMFSASRLLQNVEFAEESLDWSSCTDFSYLFYDCNLLKEIPLIDTSSGTNFQGVVNQCYNLESFPLINTINGTSFQYMFDKCYKLESLPLLNLSSALTIQNMFRSMYSLKELPDFNTQNATNMTNITQSCTKLTKLPAWNLNSIAPGNMPYYSGFDISVVEFTNIGDDFTIINGPLDRDNIVNIFNNLKTVVGKTITISGNQGTADLTVGDLLIATAKGWTVVT